MSIARHCCSRPSRRRRLRRPRRTMQRPLSTLLSGGAHLLKCGRPGARHSSHASSPYAAPAPAPSCISSHTLGRCTTLWTRPCEAVLTLRRSSTMDFVRFLVDALSTASRAGLVGHRVADRDVSANIQLQGVQRSVRRKPRRFLNRTLNQPGASLGWSLGLRIDPSRTLLLPLCQPLPPPALLSQDLAVPVRKPDARVRLRRARACTL